MFGARAAGLTLPLPPGQLRLDADAKLAHFDRPYGPGEPPRFVGRAEAMARASAALAPGSGLTTLLLHGMAGSGKTTQAMELAYRNEERFAAAAFWQAPTRDDEWQGALANLAGRLEIQLGRHGFTMNGHVTNEQSLEAYLPRLRRVMADNALLLVLDNLETLLTPAGAWRDPRWQQLLTALSSHDGESRVILTSRTVPAGLAQAAARPAGTSPFALIVPVNALSLVEAAALARELPNLRELLHADGGPFRAGPTTQADRDRVRRVLRVVQGHPKLMELADAAAADRDRLDGHLDSAERAAVGQSLNAFFRTGDTSLDPDDFVSSLAAWTKTALSVLLPEARLMAEFVACLEDDDRQSDIIEANWAGLWRRLERPGDPPAPGPLLDALTAAALVEAGKRPGQVTPTEPGPTTGGDASTGGGPGTAPVAYRVHPGVAEPIIKGSGPGLRAAVDAELAAFWEMLSESARQHEDGEVSALVVQASLAAAPYLLRQQDWDTASTLLEQAAVRDQSPGLTQAVLPSLRRIAAATRTPADAGVLARVLMRVDPAEAEQLLRGALQAAAEAGHYRGASAASSDLFLLLRDAGRLAEALAVAEQASEFTRRAGLGPWTQLADRGRQLEVLGLMGNHARVLAETDRLREEMAALPYRRDLNEAIDPWNVREGILETGRDAALATEKWERCLALNAEITASLRGRGAGIHEMTGVRFADAEPLLGLGRLTEAGRLLTECQQVFEDLDDTTMLAKVLATRADLEDELGRPEMAANLMRTALRLLYTRPNPVDIAFSHSNLAYYLKRLGADRAGQLAHQLVAALIYRLAGMDHDLAGAVRALAGELRADDGAQPSLPSTVAELITVAERTEGVHLGALLTDLQPNPQATETALRDILRTATRPQRQEKDPRIAALVEQWERVIADIAAACRSGRQPPPELVQFLREMTSDPTLSALATAWLRILFGERDEPGLLADLDEISAAIARETLARIAQPG